MKIILSLFIAPVIFCLSGCTSVAKKDEAVPMTRTEAKSEACPESIMEAGASAEDCTCVEARLYILGQKAGALKIESGSTHTLFGKEEGKRKIAIGLLRHDAMEQCGLFDANHIVFKNL